MTLPDPDAPARAAASEFARRFARHCEKTLGAELLGAYLIGSLAHGGFNRRYSDIDLALITPAGLSPPLLERLRADAGALSADWASRISVFWADRRFSLGRFPPLDVVDFLDHAVALIERERVRPARPTLQNVRDYLGGAPFAGWAARAHAFAASEVLAPQDRKAYVPARAPLSGAAVLELDDRPHGLERRGGRRPARPPCGRARRRSRRARPALPPGRGRSRYALPRARHAAGTGRGVRRIPGAAGQMTAAGRDPTAVSAPALSGD
jgi:predicted nucleotidyltransferase